MALTDVAIRRTKPRERAYKLYDEKGLYLLVSPTGAKLWRLKYRVAGKEKTLALGAYPDRTLVQARDDTYDARKLIRLAQTPLSCESRKSAIGGYAPRTHSRSWRASGTPISAASGLRGMPRRCCGGSRHTCFLPSESGQSPKSRRRSSSMRSVP